MNTKLKHAPRHTHSAAMNTHLACADCGHFLAGQEHNLEHIQYGDAYDEFDTRSFPTTSWHDFAETCPAEESELLSSPCATNHEAGLPLRSWAAAAAPAGPEHLTAHSDVGFWADAGVASTYSAGSEVDASMLSNALIQSKLQAKATPESCARIRDIAVKVQELADEGIVQVHVAAAAKNNSVWGFKSLAVSDPLRFNQVFCAIAPQYARPFKSNKPLRKPTEVFMKTMRFCGVVARRGSRGPAATDSDSRDFLYSHFYDFLPGKEDYNRQKLCPCGYYKEVRESAGKRKGEFIQTFAKRTNLPLFP